MKYKLIRKVVEVGGTVEIPDNAIGIKRYDEVLKTDRLGNPTKRGAKIYYLVPVKKKSGGKGRVD